MHYNRRLTGAMAGALTFATLTQVAWADDSHGFIEDSSLTLNTRTWFSKEMASKNNLYRYNTKDGPQTSHSRTAWVEGLKLDFRSGYTTGAVGVGTDISVYSAIALDRSTAKAAGGSNRMLVNKDGSVVDDWSKLGIAALKLRFADTQLKVGRQQVDTPMMSYFDLRALPSSFDGASLENTSISGLTLKAGYFDHTSARAAAGTEELGLQWASRAVTPDWNGYVGGDYKFGDDWRATAYVSRLEDVWNRQYLGLAKQLKWGDLTTRVRLDAYNTASEGQELAGNISQQAYGLTVTPTWGADTLKFGLQKIVGNEWFDYVRDSDAMSLPNKMGSYFNGPNETSFQVAYTRDWAAFMPGLTSLLWYIRGWGIDGTDYKGGANGAYTLATSQDDESHYEVGAYLIYAFQSSKFKGASLAVGSNWLRTNSTTQIEGNVEEARVVLNVPLRIF
jgi:hypothetical protein